VRRKTERRSEEVDEKERELTILRKLIEKREIEVETKL
jgi:hypothetical protein